MKNEIRNTITLAILLFFSISIFAQSKFVPGHIYNVEKDTIAGWICLQGNADLANGCIFRQTPKGKSHKYGFKELTGFKIDNENRVFNKRTVEYIRLNREVFLETIISGDLSLLYWLDLKTGEVLYLSKKSDSTLITLPFEQSERSFDDGYTRRRRMVLSTMHQDTLHKYMKDRTDLFNDIENIRMPTLSNLTKLVLKFNHLSENAVIKNPNFARQPISIYLTPSFSNFNFKLTSTTNWDYYGGATFGVGFHGKKDILGFEVGVLKRMIRGNSVYHDNLSMYRIPVNLVYRFTNYWFQPFLTVGVDGFIDRYGIQYFFGPTAGFNIKIIDRVALSYRFGIDMRRYNYQVFEPLYAIVTYPYMTAGIQFRL
jgi:hypothetical protein